MEIETRKRPKRRFTCYDENEDKFHPVKTTSPGIADRKTGYSSALIIQGTIGDISLKRIDSFPSGEGLRSAIVYHEKLEPGDICDIEGGDPVRIKAAKYVGMETLGTYDYFAFTSVGTGAPFWIDYWSDFTVSNIQKK